MPPLLGALVALGAACGGEDSTNVQALALGGEAPSAPEPTAPRPKRPWFSPGYKWYSWSIGSSEATELPDQAPSAEGSGWRVIDGKVISFANNEDYSETTLVELDETGRGRPGLAVPGWITTMLRAY